MKKTIANINIYNKWATNLQQLSDKLDVNKNKNIENRTNKSICFLS